MSYALLKNVFHLTNFFSTQIGNTRQHLQATKNQILEAHGTLAWHMKTTNCKWRFSILKTTMDQKIGVQKTLTTVRWGQLGNSSWWQQQGLVPHPFQVCTRLGLPSNCTLFPPWPTFYREVWTSMWSDPPNPCVVGWPLDFSPDPPQIGRAHVWTPVTL